MGVIDENPNRKIACTMNGWANNDFQKMATTRASPTQREIQLRDHIALFAPKSKAWLLKLYLLLNRLKIFRKPILGLLSRISRIWVTFFDHSKINEMNWRLNQWAQTAYGVSVSIEIMKWSSSVLQDTGFY